MAGTPQPNTPTTMGKQVSVLRIKGSVGEVTGYKMNTSSKTNKSGDFIRSKATQVANPRTYSQAKQRAKARPAQLFYDAFANVENHAFFPLGKPIKNRNRFLSKAMKLDYVPDVKKGEVKLPFAPYQISEGVLGLDDLCIGSYTNSLDSRIAFENFPIAGSLTDVTVAEFSSAVIGSVPRLQEGEELTFLCLLCSAGDPSIRLAQVYSVVLDTGNTATKLADIFDNSVELSAYEGVITLSVDDEDIKMLAAGLIISSRSEATWLYTNSYMALTAYAIDGFDWNERDIIESYMNETVSRGSNKVLQQADNKASEGGVHQVSVGNRGFELADGTTGTTSKNEAALLTMSNNQLLVIVGENNNLLWFNAELNRYEGISITIGQTSRPLTIADTTWAGSPTISKDDVAV